MPRSCQIKKLPEKYNSISITELRLKFGSETGEKTQIRGVIIMEKQFLDVNIPPNKGKNQ